MAAAVSPTAATTPPRESWSGVGVSVGDVLERLAVQRRPSGGGPPTPLAGVLNLIAYAPSPADLAEMRALVEGLADDQPSRAVLVVESEGGAGIDAEVGTGRRRTGEGACVAVELVVLTLRGEAREGAASAITPLLRPDLPTVLWWPAAPDGADGGALDRVAELADRAVTEAGRHPDAAAGVRALAGWVPSAHPAVTDLSWAAITPWRQLIVQMIDEGALAALRSAASAAVVTHGAPAPDAESLLMAGWLRALVGERLVVSLRARPDADRGLIGVELEGSVAGRHMAIERVAGRDAAAVRVTDPDRVTRARVLPLPEVDRARLLGGELELRRRDPGFERSLARALA